MWACVRLDDGEGFDRFPVEQGLRQGSMLALQRLNGFCGDTRGLDTFQGEKDVMDALVGLGKETGAGSSKDRRFSPGDIVMGYTVC